jgi:hypothetical protein
MRAVHVLGAVAAFGLVMTSIGCGKSPERVCDKFADLMKDDKSGSLKVKEDRSVCVREMTEMKSRDPAGYDCTADCVMGASDLTGAVGCIAKCDGKK